MHRHTKTLQLSIDFTVSWIAYFWFGLILELGICSFFFSLFLFSLYIFTKSCLMRSKR
jgi:hypothetical protein